MNGMIALKQGIVEFLSGRPELEGVLVMGAYPARRKDPSRGNHVTVGIDGVDLAPAGFGGILGEERASTVTVYGASAQITLRFDVYCPGDGGECYALYEALSDVMMTGGTRFGFLRLNCGELTRDSAAGAWRLTARAELRAVFDTRETGTTGGLEENPGGNP